MYRIPLSIFCNTGLVAMNSFSVCLFGKVFISSLFLKDSFAGYNNPGGFFFVCFCFLGGLEVHHSMPSCPLESAEKSAGLT